MWLPKNSEKKDGVNGLIAVAIDKEKGSQNALKWAVDNLLSRSATVILIHVKISAPSLSLSPSIFALKAAGIISNGHDSSHPEAQKNIFLPYRVFCTRKDIQCKDVLLEDTDVSRALIDYASQAGIEHLILGSSAKTSLL
ncbi:U-box domain-containing protein, partial [Trifolium medium]|nr:U-box domain-containing protein [Trifolium medium]